MTLDNVIFYCSKLINFFSAIQKSREVGYIMQKLPFTVVCLAIINGYLDALNNCLSRTLASAFFLPTNSDMQLFLCGCKFASSIWMHASSHDVLLFLRNWLAMTFSNYCVKFADLWCHASVIVRVCVSLPSQVAKEELSRECDYELEAKSQKRFRSLLSDTKGFYVPFVVDNLSSRRVLTTELVPGMCSFLLNMSVF